MRRTPKKVAKIGISLSILALAMGGWLGTPDTSEAGLDPMPNVDINAAGHVSAVAPVTSVSKAIRDC